MNTNNVKFEASYGLTKQLPAPCGIEFAFVGRSNVGKSSLLNKLFERKSLARVSGVPGKTATINFYRLDDVRFADLPGYGYAKVAKDEKRRFIELINGYFNLQRPLEVVFVLMDMRHSPTKDDKQMIDFLIDNEFPFVAVLTKCDKLSKRQQEEMLNTYKQELDCYDITMIPFSSLTGEGVLALREIIDEVIENEEEDM